MLSSGSSAYIYGSSSFCNYGSLSITSGTMTVYAPMTSSGNIDITGTLSVNSNSLFNATSYISGTGLLELNAGGSYTVYLYSILTVNSVLIQGNAAPGGTMTVWVNSNFSPSSSVLIIQTGTYGTPYLALSGTVTIPSGCAFTCYTSCNIEGTGTLVIPFGIQSILVAVFHSLQLQFNLGEQ